MNGYFVVDPVKIRLNLARRQMTRKELCMITGIKSSNFSIILKRGTVRPKTAGAIADALGVDVTEIIVTEERKKDG